MKQLFRALVRCALSISVAAGVALAMPAGAANDSLVGTWLVMVSGEAQTRNLVISEQAPSGTGALLMARYGLSGTGGAPIEARLVVNDGKRELHMTTQAATRVVAAQQPDGEFKGSFTLKNGDTRDVSIVRVEANDPRLAGMPLQGRIHKPAADVPADCAAFSGGWSGEWPRAGRSYLWIISIDANCAARVAYNNRPQPPSSVQGLTATTIKGDTMSLARPDGSTTHFQLQGNKLYARNVQASGFTNAAVMERVDLDSR